ncbi:hypothetical protein HJC99_01690 [Candidatus Saccharibacteria bacterium]|nr:hypothetical protein [Candidatus Saccharibacteria bacterium]
MDKTSSQASPAPVKAEKAPIWWPKERSLRARNVLMAMWLLLWLTACLASRQTLVEAWLVVALFAGVIPPFLLERHNQTLASQRRATLWYVSVCGLVAVAGSVLIVAVSHR